ncbi:hypothetical protein P153DRAFT_371566 [Dothidotthia symphoricarpi CBS 119687]|uniref:RING-type domain-containing protein n=1 Tax=Dothidotthia symphoricarpi CBS 119687 TaxID=1392245 RepID=A0A6A5ZWC4_9PLEO|nr:uncharacterized protein P153DRAFT_371566 [Dothidotthia symphoricarpi CBS 119687]KAF2123596.1 hypothetical protein P153DRAFT_371566 [Dothidotthia symphoricarpi CBS 119687]
MVHHGSLREGTLCEIVWSGTDANGVPWPITWCLWKDLPASLRQIGKVRLEVREFVRQIDSEAGKAEAMAIFNEVIEQSRSRLMQRTRHYRRERRELMQRFARRTAAREQDRTYMAATATQPQVTDAEKECVVCYGTIEDVGGFIKMPCCKQDICIDDLTEWHKAQRDPTNHLNQGQANCPYCRTAYTVAPAA